MFPGNFVQSTPDKPAVIRPATGESITYRELDERSTQLARYFRSVGAKPGDHVALISNNDLRAFEVYWAALRSGLYITAVNWHLTAAEAAYIVDDCEATILVASGQASAAVPLDEKLIPRVRHRLVYGGARGLRRLRRRGRCAVHCSTRLAAAWGLTCCIRRERPAGRRGIKGDLPEGEVNTTMDPYTAVFAPMYGFDSDTVYLCPAPVYHAAPLRFCGVINSVGGTVILMDAFEAETALELIGKYAVTHSQWVPTMFVRMLKLPKETRDRYDVSTVKVAIHAAAPCPPEVKTAMIDWWGGPVIYEYYASTEGSGATFINSEQALSHPGSVGRDGVMGIVHICDDAGRDLPVGEIGTVFWERETLPFRYHNDPEKTAAAQHPDHPTWTTSGDIGYIDSERFLYLTDRAAFTIISGGVNIYPQESENILTLHPKVFDVAVIGVPDEEMGEQVKAVVQLAEGIEPGAHVAEELLEYVRSQVAHFKAPRSIDFADELPRTATGKLVKHKLRSQYVSN